MQQLNLPGINDWQRFVLNNGMRVYLNRNSSEAIEAILKFGYGALHEKPKEEGLAHFLEHALYSAGSVKFSPSMIGMTQRLLGHSNATTSYPCTKFEAGMLPSELEMWLEVISDTTFNPVFNKKEVEQERERVIRETVDDQGGKVQERNRAFHQAAFQNEGRTSRSILGDLDVLKNFTIDQLIEFHKRGYGAANADLIIAGAIPENTIDLVAKYFENQREGKDLRTYLQRKTVSKQVFMRIPEIQRLNTQNPEMSSAYLEMLLPAPDNVDQDHVDAEIMTMILGGKNGSRLFNRVSMQRGLVYGISSQHQYKGKNKFISIRGNIHARRQEEALDLIFEEMEKLRTQPISSYEIVSVVKPTAYALAQGKDLNHTKINILESEIDHNINAIETINKLENITAGQILACANKYLPSSRENGIYAVRIIDPHATEESLVIK